MAYHQISEIHAVIRYTLFVLVSSFRFNALASASRNLEMRVSVLFADLFNQLIEMVTSMLM